ncbi:metal-dependent transcriptional regulator [Haloglomus salinum]|uniref:metal-dependent transcriptional regulator n=1 Tax=Haloglomus salinum TaxID=2962673 RepID=UPI0020C9F8D5|nr:metal-dependent transcriptional regulator [Haloglomus salinum]
MSGRDEYVLALYIVEHQHDPPVSPGRVAERLGRSPATASEMFRKLGEDGLVDYEPYEGVALTDAGRARAEELHETYVLLSWFFRSVLDLDDHEGKAMEMAAVMDHEVAAQLVGTLPYDADVPPEVDVPNPEPDDGGDAPAR